MSIRLEPVARRQATYEANGKKICLTCNWPIKECACEPARPEPKRQLELRIVPIVIAEANTLVAHWHRHHKPLAQAKFCLGVVTPDSIVHGAAIVGRPVARLLDDGLTLEVNRCVTDGTPNACSALYSATARAAKAMGYVRVFTYTRVDEPGTSLRAAGWKLDDPAIRARSWNMPGRKRVDRTEIVGRQRWLWESGLPAVAVKFPDLEKHGNGMLSLALEA